MCVRLPTQLCQAFPHHPISNLSLSCSRWRPFCVQEHLEYTKNTSKTTPHFPQILFCFVKLQFLCHFFRFISIGKASNTPIFPSFLAFFQKEFNRLDNYGPKPRPFCIWGGGAPFFQGNLNLLPSSMQNPLSRAFGSIHIQVNTIVSLVAQVLSSGSTSHPPFV